MGTQCTVNTLAVLDALGRYGVFGLVGAQWDSGPSALSDGDAGGPPLAGLSAYVDNIKSHPALLGYYLFVRPPAVLLDLVSAVLQSRDRVLTCVSGGLRTTVARRVTRPRARYTAASSASIRTTSCILPSQARRSSRRGATTRRRGQSGVGPRPSTCTHLNTMSCRVLVAD